MVARVSILIVFADKTIKLWKVSERDKRAEGYNLKEDSGILRDPSSITSLRVPVLKPMELMVEASPRRIFANAHTYHINSISVNSDQVRGNRYLLSLCFSPERRERVRVTKNKYKTGKPGRAGFVLLKV